MADLLGHWGYPAIFVVTVLGNAGLPVPEETVLLLAGYLVWRGQLRLPIVIAVGFVSAVVGDNIGYWIGHHYGRGVLDRHAWWMLGHPDRLEAMQRFMARRGMVAVFVARFVPGLRFMAGPLAGALGLPVGSFLLANIAGAALYVPLAVGLGCGIGAIVGEHVERARHMMGDIELVVLALAGLALATLIGWRLLLARRGPDAT
ncbi:MAG: DedA family protein [Candidatus Rokubacteria bacterium]|nr:DedA family protein [Candidatus Rokubacteria bacterium]